MFPLGVGVQRYDLFGCESDSDDLHGSSPPPAGTSSSATLQVLDVIPSLGLVRPLLDLLVRHLLVTHHDKIV